jgi:hypothetical protein
VACEAGAITCPTCGRRVVVAATSCASSSWGPEVEAAAAAGGAGGNSSHPSSSNSSGGWSFELVVGSPAGQQWPLPLVSAVRVVFPGAPSPAAAAGGPEGPEAGPGSSGGPSTSSSGGAGLAPARLEGPAPFRIQRHVTGSGSTPAQGHPPHGQPGAAADAAGQGQQHGAVKEEGASPAAAEQVSGAEGAGAAGAPCCLAVALELELVASAADAERRYVQVSMGGAGGWGVGEGLGPLVSRTVCWGDMLVHVCPTCPACLPVAACI